MNARLSQISSAISAKSVAVAAFLSVPVFAMAQATDPFTAAAADITTKVGEYGAVLVGVAAASVVFMVGIKYVKKIRGAA